MYRRIPHITLLLLTVITVCFTSCEQKEQTPKNVLLFLSYDEHHTQYEEYLEAMTQTFVENGYAPDYRICYFDLEYNNRRLDYTLKPFMENIKKEGWTPDIVITEGDRVVKKCIENNCDTIIIFDESLPCIMGALHYPEHLIDKYDKHANIVIWKERICFRENIDLAVELSGTNCVGMEIDFHGQDSLERLQLDADLRRPPYINNSDFHHLFITDALLQQDLKDSVLVCVISAEEPSKNVPIGNNNINGKGVLQKYMCSAHRFPFIVVKKDVFCDFISMKTDKPQFAATRSVFNDGTPRYLAGYFSSYSTIAKDCALTAVEIFKGKKASSFPVMEHKKEYWMDYRSMEVLDMPYDHYAKKYNIVNAPFKYTHHYLWITAIVLAAALIITFVVLVALYMRRIRQNIRKREKEGIKEARYLSKLCMDGSENIKIDHASDIKKLVAHIHPDQTYIAKEILDKSEINGTYNYSVLCDFAGDGTYEPWDFRFVVDKKEVTGIAVNMKSETNMQERIKKAVKSAEEAKKKEHFMMNISQEIKKLLDIISQCCERIVVEGISDKEKRKLGAEVSENSKKLTDTISNILLFSRIESGRQRYSIQEHCLEEMANDLYSQYKYKIPENIKFNLRTGRPDIYVKVDKDRLYNIIYQYISNAIKFTAEGTITIGWRYHLGKNICEMFIEDTGIGITSKKQKEVFSTFVKESGFIEGVGLGLNISKSLAEAMKGKIGVESKENIGSRFSIWIEAYHKEQNHNDQES